jgi:hypothetical protein
MTAISILKPRGDSERCGLRAAENSMSPWVMLGVHADNMDCRGGTGNADCGSANGEGTMTWQREPS